MSVAVPLPAFGAPCRPAIAQRWRAALLVLVAAVAFVDLWALGNWRASVDPSVHGSLLVELGLPEGGWRTIRALDERSPLRAAGAAVGDAVRMRPGDSFLRDLRTDESIRVDLRSGGSVRELAVQPVPDPSFRPVRAAVAFASGWLARLLSLVIGALIVLRRAENAPLRGVAIYLILQNALGWYLALPGGRFHDEGVTWLFPSLDFVGNLAALWAALQIRGERRIWDRRRVRALFAALALLYALPLVRWNVQWRADLDAARWFSAPGLDGLSGESGYWAIAFLLDAAMVVFLWSWWRAAHGAMRQRLAWVGLGLGLPKLWLGVEALMWIFRGIDGAALGGWPFVIGDVSLLVGSLALGWGVLRHRVFNLGLVVQRALVFSIVSTLLIMVLGLGKWLTETWLHASGGQRNFAYDAVVAMAVVGAFAFLQNRVTRLASRVFFRAWHEKAEGLRRFVAGSIEIPDGEALKSRFVDAVDAFTGGTGSALYSMGDDGDLHLLHGTLPGAPERIARGSALGASLLQGRVDVGRLEPGGAIEWAFPMAVRGQTSGALLVGPRADGVAYRPEEVEQLAESARHVGLGLEALRVVELEQAHRELARRYQELARIAVPRSADADADVDADDPGPARPAHAG